MLLASRVTWTSLNVVVTGTHLNLTQVARTTVGLVDQVAQLHSSQHTQLALIYLFTNCVLAESLSGDGLSDRKGTDTHTQRERERERREAQQVNLAKEIT